MKAYFLSRLLREKLLLLVLVAAGAVLWASGTLGRAASLVSEYRVTSRSLDQQQLWLDREQVIEEEVAAAIRNLDPARSYDGVRLAAELNRLATAAGIADIRSITRPAERTEQFAVNSLDVTINRADWAAISRFYLELSKRAPYITIEQFTMAPERTMPDPSNPLHTVQLRVAAVEISSGAR